MTQREPWQDSELEGMLSAVKEALTEHGFQFTPFEENAVTAPIRTDVATYQLFVSVDDERDTVGVYLSFPSRVPEARRLAAAELCARINRTIFLGNLDIDFADGDLRWRAGIDVEDGILSTAMIDNMIGAGVWTLDRYHDALLKVFVAGVEPEAALREMPQ